MASGGIAEWLARHPSHQVTAWAIQFKPAQPINQFLTVPAYSQWLTDCFSDDFGCVALRCKQIAETGFRGSWEKQSSVCLNCVFDEFQKHGCKVIFTFRGLEMISNKATLSGIFDVSYIVQHCFARCDSVRSARFSKVLFINAGSLQ